MVKRICLGAAAACAAVRLSAMTPEAYTEAPDPRPAARSGDTDWRYYNRTPTGDRFSALNDIDESNVGQLKELCRVRVVGLGPFSSSITAVDGILYVTTMISTVAINATNCEIVWKANASLEERPAFNTHRGVGYGEGRVVRGTTDTRLVAYDALTGEQRWKVKVGEPSVGEWVSSAPQIWDGLVFAGLAGGDWGIRGRMMAFDLKTGRQVWSFNLIPAPGELGNDTWAGESWKHGGGGTWTSYTIDPATGELFVPVADPAMTWNGYARAGANLFTDSVLVLDARTGRYLWHYQTLAHDTHDYGVTSPPILTTLKDGRKVVAVTPKDGLLYLIDRKTHKLIYKVPATTILNLEVQPTVAGTRFCPGIYGGSEWSSPAYDPIDDTIISAETDWCTTVKRMEPVPPYFAGDVYMGGVHKMDETMGGWVTAFDASSGKIRWRYKSAAPLTSGVTPTASGITFLGDMGGNLYVFRSKDGQVLRQIDTHGAIAGGVITYRTGGQQYVAATSGNISRSSWPSAGGVPSVVIFGLPDAGEKIALHDPGDPNHGSMIFGASCAGCHGENGRGGGSGPALMHIGAQKSFEDIVSFVKNPASPMPKLYPDTLSEQDVHDVARYVSNLR